MSDEWTDDDPPELNEAWKIMKEASRLQSLALRSLTGDEICWDNEALLQSVIVLDLLRWRPRQGSNLQPAG